MTGRVLVIAEAGVNHDGSLDRALALVDVAAESGADAVKFQSFRTDDLVTAAAPKADYQARNTGAADSQREMLRALELDGPAHRAIADRCAARRIEFMSTAFDVASLALLAGGLFPPPLAGEGREGEAGREPQRRELGAASPLLSPPASGKRIASPLVRRLKIASGEITNGPLLLAHARVGLPIILSTGMATLDEVHEALAVLAFGLIGAAEPSRAGFELAFASEEGQAALTRQVTLLHCTTEYPAPFDEVNLRAMATLRSAFGLPVGLSDHSVGIAVPIAAAALGAAIVEKHFTLDRTLPGPDHAASLEPAELRAMVEGIRAVEAALGDGVKAPRGAERRNMAVARRSLVAARAIAAGERFDEGALAAKRPAGGLSPMRTWDLVGRAATRAYRADEPIE